MAHPRAGANWERGLLALLCMFAACSFGRSGSLAPAARVVVTPAALNLPAGTTAQLSAQVNDAAGHPIGGAPILYSSSNPDLLSVTSRGLVTALGPLGAGRIVVSSGKRSARSTITVITGAPASIDALAGDGQRGVVGEPLGHPVSVRVSDARGNPATSATVAFTSADGGAADPAAVAADDKGVAQASWTLGPHAGAQTLTATVGEVSRTFTATAVADRVAALHKTGPDPCPVVVGGLIDAKVKLTDRFGNINPGVPVVWSIEAGDGELDAALARTDSAGIARVVWTLGHKIAQNRLTARAAALPKATVTFDCRSVAAAPAKLVVAAGDHQQAAPGTATSVPPTVQVLDRYGNPVAGAVVEFATAPPAKVLGAAAISDDKGLAHATRWILGQAGDYLLSAKASGLVETVHFSAQAANPRPRGRSKRSRHG